MLLREDTARAWEFLREHPALTGFVLVGGTALSSSLCRCGIGVARQVTQRSVTSSSQAPTTQLERS